MEAKRGGFAGDGDGIVRLTGGIAKCLDFLTAIFTAIFRLLRS
jgi:hypothetical protein